MSTKVKVAGLKQTPVCPSLANVLWASGGRPELGGLARRGRVGVSVGEREVVKSRLMVQPARRLCAKSCRRYRVSETTERDSVKLLKRKINLIQFIIWLVLIQI